MKKLLLIFIICLSGITIYALLPDKQVFYGWLPKRQDSTKLIQDWIRYQSINQNMNILKQHPLKLDDNNLKRKIVENYKIIILYNQNKIQSFEQLSFQTQTFRDLKLLLIEALTIQNQLYEENVIEYYAKHQDTQTFLHEPFLKVNAKLDYQFQNAEIEVLNTLNSLIQKNDKSLKNIDHDLLRDCIQWKRFEHQINPINPEWDTQANLKKLAEASQQDELYRINAYKALQFKTLNYQILQKMTIQYLEEKNNIFSNFTSVHSTEQAVKNLKILNHTIKSQRFKRLNQDYERISQEQQKLENYLFSQLKLAFL